MDFVHIWSYTIESIQYYFYSIWFSFLFFFLCVVIISLSLQYYICYYYFRLLLSLFAFDASGTPKVELKCVWNKSRKSEKWNRLHWECNEHRELLLLLLVLLLLLIQQKHWNVFIIMSRLECAECAHTVHIECQALLSTRESNCLILLLWSFSYFSVFFGNKPTLVCWCTDAVDSPCLFHLLT